MFPRLAQLIQMLLSTISEMQYITILSAGIVLVFSCMAMQLFSGILLPRCVLETSINEANFTAEVWHKYDDGDPFICKLETDKSVWGPKPEFVAKQMNCPPKFLCLVRENPG
jgi:hypothetical protein